MRRRPFGSPPRPKLDVGWLRLWPRKSFEFWGEVARRAQKRGVKANEVERVRSICAEVERVKKWT